MKIRVSIDNQEFEVEIVDLNARPVQAVIDGDVFEVWPEATPAAAAAPAPVAAPKPVAKPQPTAAPAAPAVKAAAPACGDSNGTVTAPIPGVIQQISVKEGDSVTFGQELLVLEAMKMKNSIKATRAGKVASIHVNTGDTVSHGQVLLKLVD